MRCWECVSSKRGGAENKTKGIWALGEARRVWAWNRLVQTGSKVEPVQSSIINRHLRFFLSFFIFPSLSSLILEREALPSLFPFFIFSGQVGPSGAATGESSRRRHRAGVKNFSFFYFFVLSPSFHSLFLIFEPKNYFY
ncbi:hypothetical protein MtrunA17_Chr1g0164451 [Medicago truncatula]|uniref:Transmembrane protein n=1 Tax=Medicago truncatula TaxID=3880 RepID=A0A396JLU1_MEDTR|nr:hypothetical protein MtrunA17_Chr1g0164451 [Medicago truncatula]